MSTTQTWRAEITAKIVAALKNGLGPWKRTWAAQIIVQKETINSNVGMPANCVTGKPYKGANFLLLSTAAQQRSYDAKWWATEKQWVKLGGKIKEPPSFIPQSDWATNIYVWLPPKNQRFVRLLRRYKVFNLAQVEGPFEKWRAEAGVVRDAHYELAEAVIAATGADIRPGGDCALYYRPQPIDTWPHHQDGDYIVCPSLDRFWEAGDYYRVLAHELIHWSEIRRGWTGSYPMGELIAEIGGVFLCELFGIAPDDSLDNHTKYVKFWLDELAQDDSAVIRAVNQASAAADFVFSFYERQKGAAA